MPPATFKRLHISEYNVEPSVCGFVGKGFNFRYGNPNQQYPEYTPVIFNSKEQGIGGFCESCVHEEYKAHGSVEPSFPSPRGGQGHGH